MKNDCKKVEMDPPQTKKQGQKGSKEKRNGFKGLHSGKGVRALTENQSLGNSKKSPKNKKN
jgi:hypothetical protein